MKGFITLSLLLCTSTVLANIRQCPGGRIEYRKGGKFCCYEKEETICTKIISPLLRDEEIADELLGDAAALKCPPGHQIVGGKCCTKTTPPKCVDLIKNEELDEDRYGRYGRYGGGRYYGRGRYHGGGRYYGRGRYGRWRYGYGRRYWDEAGDELGDEVFGDDIRGDDLLDELLE